MQQIQTLRTFCFNYRGGLTRQGKQESDGDHASTSTWVVAMVMRDASMIQSGPVVMQRLM